MSCRLTVGGKKVWLDLPGKVKLPLIEVVSEVEVLMNQGFTSGTVCEVNWKEC